MERKQNANILADDINKRIWTHIPVTFAPGTPLTLIPAWTSN